MAAQILLHQCVSSFVQWTMWDRIHSLHFEQQPQEQQKMHENIELDLLYDFFLILPHCAWSWINHDLSIEMKEIWLVCLFFYYYYSVSFIRLQLLAEFLLLLISSFVVVVIQHTLQMHLHVTSAHVHLILVCIQVFDWRLQEKTWKT